MKSIKVVLSFLMIALLMVGCQEEVNEQVYQLQRENQKLEADLVSKDEFVQRILDNYGSIEKNLIQVRAKEQAISAEVSGGTEISADVRNRILEHISVIDELMGNNRDRIDALKSELRNSGKKIKAFTESLEVLNAEFLAREQQIDTLKLMLIERDFELMTLNARLDTLMDRNAAQEGLIAYQDDLLHTAYLMIGTKEELLEKGVIERTGGIAGLGRTTQVSPEADISEFMSLDTEVPYTFSWEGKRAEVISLHPSDSYSLEGSEEEKVLMINDPQSFWNSSRLLVVMTR